MERKKCCHLFSCCICLPKVNEAVARCTFVSVSSRRTLLLMPERSFEHLHPFVLWAAFGEPLVCPSKLLCASALFWRQAQGNHEGFDSFLIKTCLRDQLQLRVATEVHTSTVSPHNVEPSVDYSRTCPCRCWWDSAGINTDLGSQVEVKTLWIQAYPGGSGETNTEPGRATGNKVPHNFIIISVSCSARYVNPVLHVFPPKFVRGGEPRGLIDPLHLPPPTENSSITADSFSVKPSFH